MEILGRADTSRTMVSRAHSTGELHKGLSHILMDASSAEVELPNDLESLKDRLCVTWIG